MTAPALAFIADRYPGWHPFFSRTDDGRPRRVWAATAVPGLPNDTSCGETVDADTPEQLAELLAARGEPRA
jgi:hypothetical protein